MEQLYKKVKTEIDILSKYRDRWISALEGFCYEESPYFSGGILPNTEGWKEFLPGTILKGVDLHYWFHKKLLTPPAIEGTKLYFRLYTGHEGEWAPCNPQAMLYLNGRLIQGMDINHTEALLEYEKEYDLYVYFYTGMLDNRVDFLPYLVAVDVAVEQLYYDLKVPCDCLECIEAGSDNWCQILMQLNRATNYLDFRSGYGDAFRNGLKLAQEYISNEFYGEVCGKQPVQVACVGHTHIDVAWKWTLAQTREKAQRSFATALRLMEQYPEYRFMASQPQLYQYVKEANHDLYEEIRATVKAGKWEAEGAMWLESDTNLVSGESLIRQVLYGKRFFQEEFGVDSKILWLPDVFGYSASLPQIMKKCGIDKFVTSKISWNETNKMPYDAFYWEGIDGTEMPTYFITSQDLKKPGENDTETTYIGFLTPSQIAGTWKRYQQKAYSKDVMHVYGFGDGGGGPTSEMLETQRRLSKGIPGIPQTYISTTKDFLERHWENFEKNQEQLSVTPKWYGELYLELHRGTYTSMARNKRANRKSEQGLYELELWNAVSVANRISEKRDLEAIWKKVLLNQFHDILPGSAIRAVYEDSAKDYQWVAENIQKESENQIAILTSTINTEGGVVIYNPHSFAASGIVTVNNDKYFVDKIPPLGWKTVVLKKEINSVYAKDYVIENELLRVRLNEQGEISSIYDKQALREVVPSGAVANELQVFEDYPTPILSDAWDISEYYKQKMWTIKDVRYIEPFNEGVCAGYKIVKKYLTSTIKQTICLYSRSKRIDFITEVDWKENHQLLKVAFPVTIKSNHATYEIPFGSIERPIYTNTSWDRAKFEVCGQRWADISDHGYGVSLLNDCKYGYSTERNCLKLTLIKCATYPNVDADREYHYFTYALYPHQGDFCEGRTLQEAAMLNQPLTAISVQKQAGMLPEKFSFVGVEQDNIIVSAVKCAEEGMTIIIRAYEAYDQQTKALFHVGVPISKVYLCDLLENKLEELPVADNTFTAIFSNYEIKTFRVEC